jgi:hypothetical protein
MAEHHQARRHVEHAHAQALERRRYQAALAQRPFRRVAPENRRVAAAWEPRGEAALRARHQAEAASGQPPHPPVVPLALTPEVKAAWTTMGHTRPPLWNTQT